MLNKLLLTIFLFILTGSAHGQAFCVRPVPGGELVLNTETNRLTGIPIRAYVMPGYKGAVFDTRDNKKLLHFNGKALAEIKDDFPHVSGFAYRNIQTDLMGNAYGFGSKPKGIFYLPKDGTKWQALEDPKEYKGVRFDRGSGDVYFFRQGAWERIRNGEVVGRADLPKHETGYIHAIRSVPELSGVFVLIRQFGNKRYKQHNQSLWFKSEGGDWQDIDIPARDTFNLLIDLNKSTFEVSDNLVSIFRGGRRAPLFLSKTAQGLKFHSVGPAGHWRQHAESKSWVAWVGELSQRLETKSMFGFLKRPNTIIPPKLSILRNGATTAEEIKGVKPHSSKGKLSISYRSISHEAMGLHFIPAETGLVVFDGTDFLQPEALRYANIGKVPRIRVLNEEAFIQSQKGVFRLSPELEVTQIDSFPITGPSRYGVDINYFEQADRFLISGGDKDEFFTSPDMKVFTELKTKEKAWTIKAVLQDPPSALVGGRQGKVYMVTQDCSVSE